MKSCFVGSGYTIIFLKRIRYNHNTDRQNLPRRNYSKDRQNRFKEIGIPTFARFTKRSKSTKGKDTRV